MQYDVASCPSADQLSPDPARNMAWAVNIDIAAPPTFAPNKEWWEGLVRGLVSMGMIYAAIQTDDEVSDKVQS